MTNDKKRSDPRRCHGSRGANMRAQGLNCYSLASRKTRCVPVPHSAFRTRGRGIEAGAPEAAGVARRSSDLVPGGWGVPRLMARAAGPPRAAVSRGCQDKLAASPFHTLRMETNRCARPTRIRCIVIAAPPPRNNHSETRDLSCRQCLRDSMYHQTACSAVWPEPGGADPAVGWPDPTTHDLPVCLILCLFCGTHCSPRQREARGGVRLRRQ